MKFTIKKHERYVVIEPLIETLNGKNATQLKGEFMLRNTGGQRNIVLNLGRVRQADEAGLRVALLARRLCKAMGGLFVLTGLNPKVADLLKLSGLDGYFKIAGSVSEAETMIFGNEIRLDLQEEQRA